METKSKIKTEEVEKALAEGEDLSEYFEISEPTEYMRIS